MSDSEDIELGPGAAFTVILQNEILLEKLKLLNFEKEFVKKQRGIRTISRITFSVPNNENQGEQFTQFIKLTQYLLQTNGVAIEVDEFDDPGAITSQIMESCRRLGVNVDFPPQKIRKGHGNEVVKILTSLADLALDRRGHRFFAPKWPIEAEEAEEAAVDDSDPELEMDEEIDDFGESDDDGAIIQIGATPINGATDEAPISKLPAVDRDSWRDEVERLTPQLKLVLRSDQTNWRQRIDQLKASAEKIESGSVDTVRKLNAMGDEIGADLDKMKSRERHINQQLDHLVQKLRVSHDRLAQVQENYNSQTAGLAEKSNQLADVSNELEKIKSEMEERAATISDNKPLALAKKARGELEKEICELDVRIATIENDLHTFTVVQAA